MRYEKASVYSKGFKGLPDGWKPIAPLTFVTGENSTGKTSLLELISILGSHTFNLTNGILDALEDINETSDVVSRFGDGKSVTIGYIAKSDSETQEEGFIGKIVEFTSSGRSLVPKTITVILKRTAVKVIRRGQTFSFKRFVSEAGKLTISRAQTLTEAAHFDKGRGYKKVRGTDATKGGDLPAWTAALIAAIIQEEHEEESARNVGMRFFSLFDGLPFSVYRYGPIRGESEKFYPSRSKTEFDSGGEHYPYRIKDIADTKPKILSALNHFGRESGLFDNVRIERLSGSRGAEAFSVVYEKFGKNFLANELGYGVGQIVPIATDLLSRSENCLFLIQQPEVHLHPKAQAEFGTLLYSVASSARPIIVETHSDFIIDRFRLERSRNGSDSEAQILFFQKNKKDSRPTYTKIPIDDRGDLLECPASYRDFFVKESIKVFENL